MIIMMAFVFLGCSQPEVMDGLSDDKVLEGKIVELTGNELFLELIGDSQKFSDKISVSVEDEKILADLEEGQLVKVWYDQIRESYPPQTRGLKVEKLAE
jgi:hypothetical protein